MQSLKPDATGIYVASHQATAAIEEAIEAEVPLIVAVAEREWISMPLLPRFHFQSSALCCPGLPDIPACLLYPPFRGSGFKDICKTLLWEQLLTISR